MMIVLHGYRSMTETTPLSAFNSPLETGIRSLAILVAGYPNAFDLQRLVELDYLVVHSGDAGGPESLHVPLPHRAGELLVRRGLIEKGLMLMISRGLVLRLPQQAGIEYSASENAAPFLATLSASYTGNLRNRAKWTVNRFNGIPTKEIRQITQRFFEPWSSQFHPKTTS